MQRAASATSNKQILLRVTSNFFTEQLLQRVTSAFLQRATSTTSKERILQQVTSDFTTSNEPRVKSNEKQLKVSKLNIISTTNGK